MPVLTCHKLSFEPQSGLRNEFGFILGVTLEENTDIHSGKHTALRSPPSRTGYGPEVQDQGGKGGQGRAAG